MNATTTHCHAETIEHPDKLSGLPYGFEVVCSIHGTVFSYNVTQVRALGEKEIQRQIDVAWVSHAATSEN